MNSGLLNLRYHYVLLGSLLLTATSCGPAGIDLGPIAPVNGFVKYRGQPVTSGIITYHCRESGQVANAELQADGRYQMRLGDRTGLPLGTYHVYIRPPIDAEAKFPPPTRVRPKPKPAIGIPAKYQTESTSGLQAKVIDGENKFDFELNDDPA